MTTPSSMEIIKLETVGGGGGGIGGEVIATGRTAGVGGVWM